MSQAISPRAEAALRDDHLQYPKKMQIRAKNESPYIDRLLPFRLYLVH
jgi:hypothetical protein